MFKIDGELTIHLTRGDSANLDVFPMVENNGEKEAYTFVEGDVVRLSVVEKGNYSNVVLRKDVEATAGEQSATIKLTKDDTRFGEVISAPVEYWYEIEINPDKETAQTIVGYDDNKAKKLMLYPEAVDSK